MIELKNLHCVRQSGTLDSRNRPLDELDVLDHIHGCLILQPDDGPPLHNYGYWNADDACIGEWLIVFERMNKKIESGGNFTFDYPFPDQGDPRLEFIFSDDLLTIRTTYYTDDLWTEVDETTEQTTDRGSFEQRVRDAIELIESTILRENPSVGANWLARHRVGLIPNTTTYFAAHSDASLRSVWDVLQAHFGLPDYVEEWLGESQFVSGETEAIRFHIFRARNSGTLEVSIDGWPSGSNFQIIAYYEHEPDDLERSLQSALGAETIRYHTKQS